MSKQLAILVHLAATLLVLFSCSPNTSSPTATPAPASSPAAAVTTPAVKESPVSKPPVATPVSKQGWEKEWEDALAGAKKEGKVVIYTTAGSESRGELTKAFKTKYGLDAEFVVGTGLELAQKLIAESTAGQLSGDIYMAGTTTPITLLKPKGMFDPIKPKLLLPEVTNEKNWYKGQIYAIDKERQYGIPIALYPKKMSAKNTEMVTRDEVKSYADFLNPKWKGKIVMGDPTVNGAAARTAALVGSMFIGWDYWRQLIAKQDLVFTRDMRLATEWVARGKYAILIGVQPDPVVEFKKAGAPVKLIEDYKEGLDLGAGASALFVMKGAPHPNATKVFVNWVFSKEGQTMYSKINLVQAHRDDVPTDFLDPDEIRDPKVDYFISDDEDFLLKEASEIGPMIKSIFDPVVK